MFKIQIHKTKTARTSWIPAPSTLLRTGFAGMTIGGASPTLQRQVVRKIASYIGILKNYQFPIINKKGAYTESV